MVATEVGFPSDAFAGWLGAERGEGNHEMRMPAVGFRIDAGFAGLVAVPGGVVFAVAA